MAAEPTNPAVVYPGQPVPVVNAGLYNPTEAGSYYDSYTSVTAPNGYQAGRPSTSRVHAASKPAGNQLTTRNQMAFWGRPGLPGGNSDTDLSLSANRNALSDYYVDKTVTIGGSGLPANAIAINTTFTIPSVDQNRYVKIVPMIAFLNQGLFTSTNTRYDRYNRSERRVEPIANTTNYDSSTGNRLEVDPILVSTTSGGDYSIGIFNEKFTSNSPTGTFDASVTYTESIPAQNPNYMTNDFHFYRKGSGPFVSGTFQFRTYFVVGTRQDVINSLQALVNASDAARDVTPAVTAVTASSAPVAGEQAVNAKDNNVNTKWLANGTGPTSGASIQYTLNTPRYVAAYSITSANDVPGRDPRNWRFEGSNDNATWATLDTRSDQEFGQRFATKTYQTQTAGTYRYYRLTITANNGNRETFLGGTGLVQLSEFRLGSA